MRQTGKLFLELHECVVYQNEQLSHIMQSFTHNRQIINIHFKFPVCAPITFWDCQWHLESPLADIEKKKNRGQCFQKKKWTGAEDAVIHITVIIIIPSGSLTKMSTMEEGPARRQESSRINTSLALFSGLHSDNYSPRIVDIVAHCLHPYINWSQRMWIR